MTILLSSLTIYPVKSCAGISLSRSKLDLRGLQHDRRWMLVNEDGKFLSQRTHPQMALIQPEFNSNQLWLTHPAMKPVEIPAAKSDRRNVTIWKDTVAAQRFDRDTDRWLSEALGISCHLVYLPNDTIRECDQNYAKPGEQTGFADAFPLLLISQASLHDLNARLEKPIEMKRFRPNLVVTGTEKPFAEDDWTAFTIGGIQMRSVKLCSRCPIPTVNPDSGLKEGPEPIKTLLTYRKKDNKVYFGQNIIHEQTGILNTGDPVILTAT